jgi:ABC-type branched-subunit amino acid transport system ATPase component
MAPDGTPLATADPVAAGDSDPAVRLSNVTVTYGRNAALRDVTATFSHGAVGLLGPNGAARAR